jgi:hypothetical protein
MTRNTFFNIFFIIKRLVVNFMFYKSKTIKRIIFIIICSDIRISSYYFSRKLKGKVFFIFKADEIYTPVKTVFEIEDVD